MSEEKHTVTVEVDLPIHKRPPQDGYEKIAWAALDTAWNLLREYAVRAVLAEMRELAEEDGIPFPSDEELLSREGGPRTYLDMAVNPEDAGQALDAAFRILIAETVFALTEGIGGGE